MFLRNKFIMVLLVVLVLANMITIAIYWLGREKPLPAVGQPFPKQMGLPSAFLINALALDSTQQAQYLDLVKIHQTQTMDLREKTLAAKDQFFDLIKMPVLNDSIAKYDVAQISMLTAQQDMATLQHFRQVRALCSPAQQQKFDSVIHQMLGIMAQQKPNMPPPKGEDGGYAPPAGRRPPPGGPPPPEKQNN